MNWSKRSNFILVVFFVGVMFAFFVISNVLYAPHKKTKDVEAFFKGNTANFIISIKTDSTLVAGIIIELSGKVTNVGGTNAVVNGNVFCQFSDEKISLEDGEYVIVKGRFIGYDDLMEEVKMDKCILKK